MPLPTTPEEWLPILAERLDKRRPETKRHRDYTSGNAPLPEMGRNLKATWAGFQKKARTDFGGLTVATVASRMVPLGVLVGDGAGAEASKTAEKVWRDNRVRSQIKQAVRDMLATRYGYILVSEDDEHRPVISRRKPEDFIAAPEPLQPWKARAYLSVWRDDDEKAEFAYVGAVGGGQLFRRNLEDASGAGESKINTSTWVPEGEPDEWDGRPKVVILERADEQTLVEPHYDIIDRINHGKLNRLVITAMQAFRQRALKAKDGTNGLPETDEDGNTIDWKAAFEPAPGALWDLPAEIADIWESQQVDITPLLAGEQTDARDYAAVTRLPVAVYTPEGANQSAEGAGVAQDGLYSQAEDEIAVIAPGINLAMVYALKIAKTELGEATVEVQWAPADRVTMTERYAAAVQAKGAGLARKTILRDVIGMSPEEIRKDESDLAGDQLAAALLTIQPQQPATASPQGGGG